MLFAWPRTLIPTSAWEFSFRKAEVEVSLREWGV